MQIYLHQNNQQEGPFTLPRISARLVSGDLDSATLAWHEGLDNWYPLNHEKWQALGIVAPPPKEKPAPQESAPVEEPQEEKEISAQVFEESTEAVESMIEPLIEETKDPKPEEVPEANAPAFASYTEADFKPPTFEEMEKQMIELRAKRAGFPETIGRRVEEINFRDDEIEEAWNGLEKALESGKEDILQKAYASLGQAVLSAGLNDPGLDELRNDEQDTSDRMLNLQMQLRRMGGVKQSKGPPAWKKWVVLGVTALLLGGIATALVLMD
jgi:hypothetical protein